MRCIFLYKIIQNFYIWIYNIYIYIISMRSVLNGRWFLKGCETMLVLSGILVMVIGLMLRFNAL